MKIVKITEGKRDKMVEYAEKILRHAGKLMQCIEDLGEREGMGERYDDDWDDDDDDDDDFGRRDEDMGRRRGVKYTGRYSRYRRR